MKGIKELLIQLIQTNAEIYSVVCKVTSIDKSARTCDCEPLNGNAPILGVRLQVDPDMTNGIVIYPVKDSNVMVTFINETTGFISLFSEVESIELVIDGISFKMDKNAIIMNDGSFGGLVKKQETTENFNSIKDHADALKTATGAIASALDLLVPGTSMAFNTAMAPFSIVIKNIENTKVQH